MPWHHIHCNFRDELLVDVFLKSAFSPNIFFLSTTFYFVRTLVVGLPRPGLRTKLCSTGHNWLVAGAGG